MSAPDAFGDFVTDVENERKGSEPELTSFSSFVAGVEREREESDFDIVRSRLAEAQLFDPDVYAEKMREEETTGVPAALAYDPKTPPPTAARDAFAVVPQILTDEVARKWIAKHPANLILTQDELPFLLRVTQQSARKALSTTASGERGVIMMARSDLHGSARILNGLGIGGGLDPQIEIDDKRMVYEQQRHSRDILPQAPGVTGFLATAPEAFAESIPFTYEIGKGAAKYAAVGAGIGLFTGPGAFATAKTFGKVGAITTAIRLEAGIIINDIHDTFGPEAAATPTAASIALAGGLVAGLLEYSTALLNTSVVRRVVRDVARRTARSQLRRSTGKIALAAAGDIARTAVLEAPVEGSQELVEIAAAQFGGELSVSIREGTSAMAAIERATEVVVSNETLARVIEAGGKGFLAGGMFAGTQTTALSVPAELVRAAETEAVMAHLDGTVEAVAGMKLRTRNGRVMQQLLKDAVEGDSDGKSMGVPISAWDEYWNALAESERDESLRPAAVAAEFGLAEEYSEASEAASGDLSIPFETLVGRLAQTEHWKGLHQHVRPAPKLLTLSEGATVLAESTSLFEDADNISEEQSIRREEARVIRDAVLTQLGDRFDANTNLRYAQVYAAFFMTQAERSGLNPVELFESQGIRVESTPLSSGREGRSLDQADTTSPEFRAFFGDSKIVNEDGSPRVVFHSGTFDETDGVAFQTGQAGIHFGTESAAKDLEDSRTEAGRKTEAYLSIQNPLRISDNGLLTADSLRLAVEVSDFASPELRDAMRDLGPTATVDGFKLVRGVLDEHGVDGFVYENNVEDIGQDSFIALRSAQVKSVNNRGTFDRSDPRILEQGEVLEEILREEKEAVRLERVAARVPGLARVLPFLTEKQRKRTVTKNANEMIAIADFTQDITPYLTPQEREKIRFDNAENIARLVDQLPDPEEMASVAFAGRAKRGWYRRSAAAILETFGLEDSPRFAALLAAMSPQTSVENNLINALNMWVAWDKAGRPTDRATIIAVAGTAVQGTKGEESVLEAWQNNMVRALSSDSPMSLVISGPKVNSFMLNLRDVVNEVTLDTWMANYSLVSQGLFAGTSLNEAGTEPGKSPGYLAMNANVRRAAEIASERTGDTWTPAEIQETIWSWAKALYESVSAAGESRTAVQILEASGLTHEQINETPDFAILFHQNIYNAILERGGLDGPETGRSGEQPDGAPRAEGSVTSAEGSGIAQDAFSEHLRQAAARLDQLRKRKLGARRPGILAIRDAYGPGNADLRSEGAVPGPYRGGDPRSRLVPGVVLEPQPDALANLASAGYSAPNYVAVGAKDFRDAMVDALAKNRFKPSVEVKKLSEYEREDARLFLTEDGMSGVAVIGDDIVSAFSDPDAPSGAVASMIFLAIQAGGRRLDAFDTVLPEFYGRFGFRAVARVAWNETFKPPGWDKAVFSAFNKGEPDIVLMVYDPDNTDPYLPLDGRFFTGTTEERAEGKDFDRAQAAQAASIDNMVTRKVAKKQLGRKSRTLDQGVAGDVTDAAVEAFNAGDTRRFNQSGFHGSQVDFDKFDSEFIGTGEAGVKGKAGAVGWGLYGSMSRGIAEWYRKVLGTTEVTFRGRTVQLVPTTEFPIDAFLRAREAGDAAEASDVALRFALHAIARRMQNREMTAKEALDDVRGFAVDRRERVRGQSGQEARRGEAFQDAVIDALSDVDAAEITVRHGQLFEVTIPEADEMLDWDKPLSEQTWVSAQGIDADSIIARVRGEDRNPDAVETAAANTLRSPEGYGARTGQVLYNDLARKLGSERAASEALAAAGIKGHVYDAGQLSGGSPSGARNFVIYDDAAIEIVRKHYHDARDGDAEARASVTFYESDETGPQEALVALGEAADKTSFLHEGGHIFLDVLEQLERAGVMSPQQQSDLNALREFAGVEEGGSFERVHHEKVQQAIERYFASGTAPSVELQGAFRSMKKWFKEVYQNFEAWFGRVPPGDLREVFDRMLATDEQIDALRAQESHKPLFATREESGMTESQWASYREHEDNESETAKEQALAAELEGVERRKTAEYRAEKKAIRGEVERATRADPVMQARMWLETGKWIGEDPRPELEALDHKRLDRQDVEEIFGKDRADELNKRLAAKGGYPLDLVASVFRLRPSELMDGLRGTKTLTQEIEARLNAEMDQRHPPSLTREESRQGAQDALANDPHGQRLAAELRALLEGERRLVSGGALSTVARQGSGTAASRAQAVEEAQAVLDGARAKIASLGADTGSEEHTAAFAAERDALAAFRQAQNQRTAAIYFRKAEEQSLRETRAFQFKIATARVRAAQAVAQIPLDQLRPESFGAQERRAAEASRRAVAVRDRDAAAQAKREQLVAHFSYREARKAQRERDQVQRRVNRLYSEGLQARMEKTDQREGTDFKAQMEDLLVRFGFLAGERNPNVRIETFQAKQEEQGFVVPVPEFMKGDFSLAIPFSKLTLAQLRGVNDLISSVAHRARIDAKLLAQEDNVNLETAAGEIIAASQRTQKKDAKIHRPGVGILANRGLGIAAAHANMSKMEFIVHKIDGQVTGGPLDKYVFQPLNRAEDARTSKTRAVVREMQEKVLRAHYSKSEQLLWKIGRTRIPAIDQAWTKDAIIAVALNMGNADNFERLLHEVNERTGENWTVDDVFAVVESLDDNDWDFVEAVWDLKESLWPEMKQMELEVNGFAPKRVDAVPFTVRLPNGKHRLIKGGYYAIVYDNRRSPRAKVLEHQKAIQAAYGGIGNPTQTRHGHLQERVGAPKEMLLRLDLTGISQHFNDAILDLSYRRALIQANRILHYPAVKTELIRALGVQMYSQLSENFLQGIASADRGNYEFGDRLAGASRSAATYNAMGWKLSTATAQYLGLFVSVQQLSVGGTRAEYYMGKAMAQIAHVVDKPGESEGILEFIRSRSELMTSRPQNFDRDVRNVTRQLGMEGAAAPIANAAFFFARQADMHVSVVTWLAAYAQAMDGNKRGLDIDDPHLEQRAIEYADSQVRRSQGSGGAKDLSEVQRGGEFRRLFTMFFSFFNVFYNIQTNRVKVTDRSAPADVARLAASALYLYVFPSVVQEMLLDRAPDYDDDEFPEWAATKMASYPVQGVPYIRDVSTAILEDRRFQPSAALQLWEVAAGLPKQAAQGDVDRAAAKAASATVSLGLGFTPLKGFPGAQTILTVDAITKLIETGSVDPLDFVRRKQE